jgi:uncharacterized membrane protein YecN with MAPEG domain
MSNLEFAHELFKAFNPISTILAIIYGLWLIHIIYKVIARVSYRIRYGKRKVYRLAR